MRVDLLTKKGEWMELAEMKQLYDHCLLVIKEFLEDWNENPIFNRAEAYQFQRHLCVLVSMEMCAQRLQVITFFSIEVIFFFLFLFKRKL